MIQDAATARIAGILTKFAQTFELPFQLAQFEDAASGAANATLAAWLAMRDALPGDSGFYRISQGREVGHDAIIELTVDAEGEVWSGGRVCSVVRGEIDWR